MKPSIKTFRRNALGTETTGRGAGHVEDGDITRGWTQTGVFALHWGGGETEWEEDGGVTTMHFPRQAHRTHVCT